MSNALYGNQTPWKVFGALGIVYFIWGSTYLGIAYAIQSIPPMLMLGARFLAAGLLVYAWLALKGRTRATRLQWKNAAVAGLLLLGIGTGTLAWAEQYIPTGLAAVLVTISPVWIVLLEWLWKGGTRPSRSTILGMVLATLGIVVLFDPVSALGSSNVNIPAALALVGGSVAWAVGSLHGRHSDLPSDPILSTSIQMIAGGIALTLVGALGGELQAVDLDGITIASIAALLYLIVFGSIVAFTAYVWLMRHTSPTLVSTHSFVNPVVAVLLGWVFLNEALSPQLFLATILLVAGLIFITNSGRRPGPRNRTKLRPSDDHESRPMPGAPGQARAAGRIRRSPVARRLAGMAQLRKVA